MRLSRWWTRRQARDDGLEARVAHLEAELEGLQDAVHRRAVVEDELIDDLRRRTAPEQLARDLSEDARRRGL
jgi:predicted kinase